MVEEDPETGSTDITNRLPPTDIAGSLPSPGKLAEYDAHHVARYKLGQLSIDKQNIGARFLAELLYMDDQDEARHEERGKRLPNFLNRFKAYEESGRTRPLKLRGYEKKLLKEIAYLPEEHEAELKLGRREVIVDGAAALGALVAAGTLLRESNKPQPTQSWADKDAQSRVLPNGPEAVFLASSSLALISTVFAIGTRIKHKDLERAQLGAHLQTVCDQLNGPLRDHAEVLAREDGQLQL